MQKLLPLRPPFLISDAARRVMAPEEGGEVLQPHPHLLSWCLRAKVDTTEDAVTAAIISFSGIQLNRDDVRNLSVTDLRFYRNAVLEDFMVSRNRLVDSWPQRLQKDVLLREILFRAYDNCLDPLREKLRSYIRNNDNDIATVNHNPALRFPLPGDAFMLLTEEVESTRVTVTANTYSIAFTSAEDMDFLFTPTEEDLRVEKTRHAYYGHMNRSRWYCMSYDDMNASAPHEDVPSINIHHANLKKVFGPISLVYYKRSSMLGVNMAWAFSHKKASGLGGGRHELWIEGTFTVEVEGAVVDV